MSIASARTSVITLGLCGLVSASCSRALDLDEYEFPAAEQEQTPPLPLGPGDAGAPASGPSDPAPVRDAGPVIPPRAPVAPVADAGAPVGPPVALPRPVSIGEPDPTLALQGSLTGGQPRTASCSGGLIVGVAYQYYTSTSVQPDRLSYVWPLCILVEPGTPVLLEGGTFAETWPSSSPDDPVFAPLRESEDINAIACPENHFVVGVDGSYDPLDGTVLFRGLSIQCAPLATNPELSEVAVGPLVTVTATGIAPALGTTTFNQACPTGSVATQLDLRFGLWLDAVGLRCATVRWPFTAGHACASGQECQSRTCNATGCAP